MTQIRQLLAMDKASRMARAAEMGLTTPGFHGTTHPFDEFRPSQANSPNWDGRPDQYAGTHFAKDRAVPRHLLDLARYNREHGGGHRHGGEYRIISAMLPDRADMKVVPQIPPKDGPFDGKVYPQDDTDAIRDFLLHEYYKSDPENLARAIAEESPSLTKQEQQVVLEHLIGPDWQSYHAAQDIRNKQSYGRETYLESMGPEQFQEAAVQLDKIKKQHDELALEQPGGRASDAWHNRLPKSVVLGRAVADGGVAALQKQGIRGLVYQNTNLAELGGINGFKRRMDTDPESYIVFDPANIRDRKAAFDPSKRLSRNLMAAVAAATATGIGLSTKDAEAAQTGKLFRAFHGSPYDFDKFDASKIGTGSGGAVYGQGWNFTKSEPLAKGWRDTSSAIHRNRSGYWEERTVIDAEAQKARAGSAEKAILQLRDMLVGLEDDLSLRPQIEDAIAYLQGSKPPRPRMYEVEIAHPEQSLLNYDKPFSTPPGAVAARILRDIDEKSMPSSTLRDIEAGVYQGNGGYLDPAARNLRLFASSDGGKALLDAGIPGLRYQQPLQNYQFGQLPAAQKQTTNYLMYPGNEDAIRIIRKYAVPALVTAAAGGAAAQAQGNSYPVVSPEEAGVDQYFQENPQVSGMAWGGGMNGSDPESQRSIVLNPHSKLSPEQYKSVERNEGIRHQMNESNWSSDFEITPEQQEWSKGLGAYANDPAALRETIIARLATGDYVPTPTEEQKQMANTFSDPNAFGDPMPEGLIERGNINLYRPTIPNPEGGESTVNSISVGFDGEHVLLPTADDGGIQTPEYAIEKYQRTGQHLGKFSTPEAADAYGGLLHDRYQSGWYKIPSPPEQESPQQPSEPVVGAPLIRYLQQEASQNAVHQQRPAQNDYNFDDHLNKPTPEGRIRGTGLKEFIDNANEKNASSPQIDYAHAVKSAMSVPVFPDGASIGDRIRRQIYADMAGKQAQMPQDSANYAEEQQKIEAHAADVTDEVGAYLAGTSRTNDPVVKYIAANVRAQLKDLSPGGKNASLGHRTQSEANQAQKEYGANAIHTFTPEGARNHTALALSELLDAKDNSQSGFLRGIETAAKTVGGFTQPLWHLVKEGSLPRDTGGTWDSLGKDPLESAAQRWADYQGSDGTKAYDPAGKPFFSEYDPTTARGLAATTQGNQAFPLANFYQNVASPMYDVAQNLTMPNYYQDAKSLRALHTTTPIIPDGVDPKVAKEHLDTFDAAAAKLTGFNSAYHGKKFADFGNALAGPNTFKRSYLSPIANMALDLPPEIFGDPLNLGVSAAIPPVAGVMSMLRAAPLGFKAAKAAGLYGLGRATLKAPFTFGDDLLGEAATGPAILAGATGIEGLFTPEKTNALMGDADPNAPGYDERLNEAAIAERERLQGSAAAYGKLVPKPKKPQTRGSVYPYIER